MAKKIKDQAQLALQTGQTESKTGSSVVVVASSTFPAMPGLHQDGEAGFRAMARRAHDRDIVLQTITNPGKSVGALVRISDNQRVQTEAAICSLIQSLNDFMNVRYKLNTEQIVETAGMIADRFGELSLVAIAKCFEKVKSGEVGKIYDRLDGTMLMRFLDEYRGQLRAQYNKLQSGYNEATDVRMRNYHPSILECMNKAIDAAERGEFDNENKATDEEKEE